MKQENTNPRKKLVWLIALVAVAVIAAAVMLLSPEETPAPTEETVAATVPTPTETTAAAMEPEEETPEIAVRYDVVELVDGQIKTPYGALNYPEALADHLIILNTSAEPYTLEFYAIMEDRQEIHLFDIALGEGSGGNLGVVKTDLGEVPLNVTIYALSFDDTWTEGEIVTAQAMQDVVNEMIEQMAPKTEKTESAKPEFIQQPVTADTVDNLRIETPYCMLYYPACWRDTIRYEHDDSQEYVYKVHFYGHVGKHEEQLLFSIYLGGDEGEQLGAVLGTDGVPVPVYLLIEELNLDRWNEKDAELMYSMQEASNQLIEKLPFLLP